MIGKTIIDILYLSDYIFYRVEPSMYQRLNN